MKLISLLSVIVLCFGCGYDSPSNSPAPQPGVVPAIDELSPDNVNAGSSDFMLTINGSKFGSNAKVNWNGTAQTTTFVSANQLTITVPASSVANAGTVPVSVTNPGTPATGGPYGSGGTNAETSNVVNFTIN